MESIQSRVQFSIPHMSEGALPLRTRRLTSLTTVSSITGAGVARLTSACLPSDGDRHVCIFQRSYLISDLC